ncbi:MAG: glycosyltransferase family 9 protein [Burkholderiales bacterium]
MTGSVRRIVVYRLGSLGDTVVALPCLHRVAQAYPDAERIMLTNVPVNAKAAPLEAILGGSGLVHGYMSYPVGTRSFAELSALRTRLRGLGADTLVYLTPSRGLAGALRDLLYFRLCGFRHIVGAPLSHDLQRHRRGADGLLERECERLVRCLAALGPIDLDDPAAWELRLSASEREAAAAALGVAARPRRIAINMGGKVLQNDWGEANWCALVTRLREACADHALVLVGAAEDDARAARVGALWPGPVANLCGRVSPRVSAAAMAGARMFIGHDSGPLHLAASVGVPCVGLYGDYHEPRKWHPHGERHRILHEMRGVLAIEVETVAQAALGVLATPEPAA